MIFGFLILGIAISDLVSFQTDEDRQPASSSSNLKVESFVHLDKIRILDFKPNHFYLLSNTQSYSQIKVINLALSVLFFKNGTKLAGLVRHNRKEMTSGTEEKSEKDLCT